MCITHGPERPVSDRTVDRLTSVEQGLLYATRLWFRARPDTRQVLPAISRTLREAEAPEMATLDLIRLLGILAASRSRPLDVHCPNCRRLGLDEAALLDALAAFQGGGDDVGVRVLRHWLPAAAVPAAAQFARDLALTLAGAGLILGVAARPVTLGADRGAALVH